MPSWKKVITSGSNASLNQITASAFQFIGSGTAELEVQGNITASGTISSSLRLETKQINTATGELTSSYGTLHGSFNINYGNATTFSSSLTSVGDGYGEIISHLNINGANVGDVVYFSGADWRPTDANAASSAAGMLGVAMVQGINTPGPVLIKGMARLADGHILNPGSGNAGDFVYLATTAGHVDYVAPSGNNDIARIVGYVFNETNEIIYFNPDRTFVTVSA